MPEIYNRMESKEIRRKLRREQTPAEKLLWSKLRNHQLNGLKFYRQYGIGFYIADFFCMSHKLVIEIDGGYHNSEDAKMNDDVRDEQMKNLGLKILRFNNEDVMNKLQEVLDAILKEIGKN